MRALTCIAVCTTLFAGIHSSCSPLRLQHLGEHTERLLVPGGRAREGRIDTHTSASKHRRVYVLGGMENENKPTEMGRKLTVERRLSNETLEVEILTIRHTARLHGL